jgi:malonyl-CoA/methylmalonyl-CoA synthetase
MEPRYLFPNDRLFQNIFDAGRRYDADRTIIRDNATGLSATMAQLLNDVGKVKQQLAQEIPEKTLKEMRAGTESWVALVLPQGYAFTVGLLAALALGAGVTPLSADIVLEEAIYFAGKAKFSAMLHGNSCEALVKETALHHQQWNGPQPASLNIEFLLESENESSPCGVLDEDLCLDPNFCPDEESSAILAFTSGTTGLPKGVVHTRKFFRVLTLPGAVDGVTYIHVSPTHWILGLWIVTSGLASGACVEFSRSVYTPQWFMDRIQTPGRYGLIGPPSIWAELRRLLMKRLNISSLDGTVPGGTIESNLRQQMLYLESAATGGGQTPSGIFQFFSRALPSCQLLDAYGSTELGQIVASATWEMKLQRSKVRLHE